MGFIDALNEELAVSSHPQCRVCQALVKMDDAADLQAALDNSEITSAAIARALKKSGVPIGADSVVKHRRNH